MTEPTHALSTKSKVKPRPRWLKALGLESPPESLQIAGVPHRLREVFKHDSWAATALYEDPEGVLRVVKLHRQAPALGLPLGWLGRRTASNERRLLEQLAGLQGIPALAGPVRGAGPVLRHAVARDYVAGHPLGNREPVSDTFFPDLNRLLKEMHKRRTVYVDLHKRENIIVNERGEPCLIDFQISLTWPRWLPSGPLFRILAEERPVPSDEALGTLPARSVRDRLDRDAEAHSLVDPGPPPGCSPLPRAPPSPAGAGRYSFRQGPGRDGSLRRTRFS